MAEFFCSTEAHLPEAVDFILKEAGETKIFLFEGPMGSGKTSLIKAICAKLGSRSHFSSPTFAIVNEYDSPSGKLFHFDLYRVQNKSELLDLGIEHYLDSGRYCFVEWPELVKDLLEDNYLEVKLRLQGESRYFHVQKF